MAQSLEFCSFGFRKESSTEPKKGWFQICAAKMQTPVLYNNCNCWDRWWTWAHLWWWPEHRRAPCTHHSLLLSQLPSAPWSSRHQKDPRSPPEWSAVRKKRPLRKHIRGLLYLFRGCIYLETTEQVEGEGSDTVCVCVCVWCPWLSDK